MRWSFTTSFSKLMLRFLSIYLVFCVLFSLIFLLPHVYDDSCINVINSNQNTTSFDKIIQSWVLSWTTFSTVGYGSIYPAHGNKCIFVRIVAGLEAFLGMLYVGYVFIFERVPSYTNLRLIILYYTPDSAVRYFFRRS